MGELHGPLPGDAASGRARGRRALFSGQRFARRRGALPHRPCRPATITMRATAKRSPGWRCKAAGSFCPTGKTYRYLVLPQHGRVTLASLRQIAAMAGAGVPIFVGTLPKGSPSLGDAAGRDAYERLTKELAARRRPQPSFEDIFTTYKLLPDFAFDKASGLLLHHVHRRIGDADRLLRGQRGPKPQSRLPLMPCGLKYPIVASRHRRHGTPAQCTNNRAGLRESRCNSIPPGSVFVHLDLAR